MVETRELVSWLDKFLDVNSIKDRTSNGLQVTGKSEIKRISLAVDPCLEVIERAISVKSDLLFTHHWIIGGNKLLELEHKRLKPALNAGLNIYCCHLPLDRHPIVGNNASLAKLLGMEVKGEFGKTDEGKTIGCWAKFEKPISFSEFEAIVKDKLKTEVQARKFGSTVARVGIVSGGGGYHVREASELGLDTVLTGSFDHHAFLDAKDLGINLVMAGHYGTEKFGVQEVGRKIKEKFPDVEVDFVDNPTGF